MSLIKTRWPKKSTRSTSVGVTTAIIGLGGRAGWIFLLLIWLPLALVTWGPVAWRPSVTDDPQFDRMVMLSMVGALTVCLTPGRIRASIAVMTATVIVLEAGQSFVTGRHAEVADALYKTAGVIVGAASTITIARVSERSRVAGLITAIAVAGVVCMAAWYVVSPNLALRSLRRSLMASSNSPTSPPLTTSALSDPCVRSAIVSAPDHRIVDLWGRTLSSFHMTIRASRNRKLVILGFVRRGLSWQLISVVPRAENCRLS